MNVRKLCENGHNRVCHLICILAYFQIFTFAYCAEGAAPVLDGGGIRIEFDSEERGFDCLSIKNRLGGGEFWTQGYRELMKPIREDAAKRIPSPSLHAQCTSSKGTQQ